MRRLSTESRINYLWLALSGLTVLAWGVSKVVGDGRAEANNFETIAVLAIAGVKGRLILTEYMEVRTAPRRLRWITDAWLGGLLVTLLAVYFYG